MLVQHRASALWPSLEFLEGQFAVLVVIGRGCFTNGRGNPSRDRGRASCHGQEVELSLVIGCRATLGCAIHDKEPGWFAGVYYGVGAGEDVRQIVLPGCLGRNCISQPFGMGMVDVIRP